MNSTERSRTMNDLHPSILIDTRHGIPGTKTQVDRIVEWVWRDAHDRVAARLAKEPHKFDRREPMPYSRHAKDDAGTITSQPGD